MSEQGGFGINALYHDLLLGGPSTSAASIALQAATGNLYLTGNLGFGAQAPGYDLDVRGNASISGTLGFGPTLQSDVPACNASTEGVMFYNAATQQYYYCNGTSWQSIAQGGVTQWTLNTTPNPDVLHPDASTTDLAIGGTDNTAPFFISAATGDITSAGNLSLQNQGDLRLYETTGNGTDYIAFQAAADLSITTRTYTWPSAVGAGYILQTDAAGVLTWIDPGTLPSSNYFTLENEQLFPKNALYHDLLIGGTSTGAATIALQASTGNVKATSLNLGTGNLSLSGTTIGISTDTNLLTLS